MVISDIFCVKSATNKNSNLTIKIGQKFVSSKWFFEFVCLHGGSEALKKIWGLDDETKILYTYASIPIRWSVKIF